MLLYQSIFLGMTKPYFYILGLVAIAIIIRLFLKK